MKPEDVDTESWWSGFNAGFVYGMVAMLVVAAISLAVAGCKIEQADKVPEIVITAHAGDDVTAITHDVLRRAGGPVRVRVVYADDFYQQPRDFKQSRIDTVLAGPSYEAAKVAAVMAAEGITLPQVASYLNTYGFDVIQRSEFRRWHWSPPTSGAPVAYYVVNFRVAVGDTTLPIYIPQGATACPYWIRVKGFTGQGAEGPWSHSNVSGAGAMLPGVAE